MQGDQAQQTGRDDDGLLLRVLREDSRDRAQERSKGGEPVQGLREQTPAPERSGLLGEEQAQGAVGRVQHQEACDSLAAHPRNGNGPYSGRLARAAGEHEGVAAPGRVHQVDERTPARRADDVRQPVGA